MSSEFGLMFLLGGILSLAVARYVEFQQADKHPLWQWFTRPYAFLDAKWIAGGRRRYFYWMGGLFVVIGIVGLVARVNVGPAAQSLPQAKRYRHTAPVLALGCWTFVDDSDRNEAWLLYGVPFVARIDPRHVVLSEGVRDVFKEGRFKAQLALYQAAFTLYPLDSMSRPYPELANQLPPSIYWLADSTTDSIYLWFSPNRLSGTNIVLAASLADTLEGEATVSMDVIPSDNRPVHTRAVRRSCAPRAGAVR